MPFATAEVLRSVVVNEIEYDPAGGGGDPVDRIAQPWQDSG